MKKKILFLFVLFFVNIFIVQAKEYTCNYKINENKEINRDVFTVEDTYNFKYDDESFKFTSLKSSLDFIYDLYIPQNGGSTKKNETEEKQIINNFAPKCQDRIYVCIVTTIGTNSGAAGMVIFDDNNKLTESSVVIMNDTLSYEAKSSDCAQFIYTSGNDNGSTNVKYKCDKYNELYAVIKNRYKKYTSCKKAKTNKCTFKDENGKEVTKATSLVAKEHSIAVDEIKAYCKNVIANQNSTDSCMKSCFSLESDLSEYLLNKSTGTDKCSLTTTIITFVSNILKWAKYIAPVLVIILSIIDFIKAIIAQNDDEMKKVQGKFIKRLIVAALLFLLPLIINFMLKTFGFYDAECDVANLFS